MTRTIGSRFAPRIASLRLVSSASPSSVAKRTSDACSVARGGTQVCGAVVHAAVRMHALQHTIHAQRHAIHAQRHAIHARRHAIHARRRPRTWIPIFRLSTTSPPVLIVQPRRSKASGKVAETAWLRFVRRYRPTLRRAERHDSRNCMRSLDFRRLPIGYSAYSRRTQDFLTARVGRGE